MSEERKMVRLGDVIEINPSKKIVQDVPDNTEVGFLPMEAVTNEGYIESIDVREIGEVRKSYTYFQNGDVIFAKITPCMENGKGALISDMPNNIGFGSTEFHVFRPDTKKLDSRYLYHFTKNPYLRIQAEKNMTGSAGQKRVPSKFFTSLSIPLPPLAEQKRIAAALDHVSSLIALRKAQIAQLELLVKARFVEMFGDIATNPFGWQTKDFEEVSEIITDGEHATPRRTNKGIYLLSARNVLNHAIQVDDVDYIDEDEYLRIAKRIVPEAGDVLISCSGSIGRCCVVPQNFKFQMVRSAAIIRFKSIVNPIFAEWLITSVELQRQISQSATQSSQANLFQGKIKKLHGYFPPLELQNQFAEFVVQTDKSNLAVQESLAKLETLKKSLMQEYFG